MCLMTTLLDLPASPPDLQRATHLRKFTVTLYATPDASHLQRLQSYHRLDLSMQSLPRNVRAISIIFDVRWLHAEWRTIVLQETPWKVLGDTLALLPQLERVEVVMTCEGYWAGSGGIWTREMTHLVRDSGGIWANPTKVHLLHVEHALQDYLEVWKRL